MSDPIWKAKMIRSKKMTEAARGKSCTMEIPGICNHNPETTVFAHSNERYHGKLGLNVKAHDIFGADMCSACHAAYDLRLYTDQFEQAMARTILRRIEQGIITVEGNK
jgi:hypothetical protein